MRLLALALFVPLLVLADSSASDSGPSLITTHGKKAKGDPKVQLQKDAAAGDGKAAYELANDFELGKAGFAKDLAQAFSWYTKAGTDGNGDGYFRLGMIYDDGLDNVAQDSGKALGYFKAAGGMGVAEAQYNVGTILVSARGGVKRDWVEGLAWLIVAGKNGAKGDGEASVRQHLARHPDTIAAAEKRANELITAKPRFAPPDAPAEPDAVSPDVPAPTIDVPPSHIGPPGT